MEFLPKKFPVFTLAVLLLGSTALPSHAKRIGNGEVVKAGDPLAKFAVRLLNDPHPELEKRMVSWCSGSLIAQNIVLTAAHCIMDDDGRPVKNPKTIKILFNRFKAPFLDLETAVVISADQIDFDSSFLGPDGIMIEPKTNKKDAYQSKDHDIALIRLEADAPSDFAPVPLARAYEISDFADSLTIAGYGNENLSANPIKGRLKKASVKLVPLGNNLYFSSIETQYGNGLGLSGDSGAPLLIETPNEGYKIGGVHNRGGENSIKNLAVRVENYSDFITRAIRRMGGDPSHLFTAPAIDPVTRWKTKLKERVQKSFPKS